MAKLTDSAPSGMLDNVDVTILKAWTENDVAYPESDKVCKCALILELEMEDGQVKKQILSAGSVQASQDGHSFQDTPKDNSKAKIFIMSLVGLNYPGIDEDVRVFEGAKIHVKTQKYESNIKKDPGEREATAFVATAIIALPKGKAKAGARPTGQGQAGGAQPARATSAQGGQGAQTAASNGEVEGVAIQTVIAVLAGRPEVEGIRSISRVGLGTAVMNRLAIEKKPAMMAPAKKLASDLEWLTQQSEATGRWALDGDNVIYVPE